MKTIRRGEVWLVALDPVVGSELAKTGPALVVSNAKSNTFSATVTVLPITSRNTERVYPFEVFLPKGAANLPKDSKIKADQIRTLDKSRLVQRIGALDAGVLDAVGQAVAFHLELD